MRSEDVQIGMLVRVNERDRNPHLRGQVGTVKQRYGNDSYAAFEVLFWGKILELFWHHELEDANEPSKQSSFFYYGDNAKAADKATKGG
jgi:hypothetical protein